MAHLERGRNREKIKNTSTAFFHINGAYYILINTFNATFQKKFYKEFKSLSKKINLSTTANQISNAFHYLFDRISEFCKPKAVDNWVQGRIK